MEQPLELHNEIVLNKWKYEVDNFYFEKSLPKKSSTVSATFFKQDPDKFSYDSHLHVRKMYGIS